MAGHPRRAATVGRSAPARDDQGIDRDRTLRQHQERVHVDRVDGFGIGRRQHREARQRPGQGIDITRRPPAHAVEHGTPADGIDHVPGLVLAERRDPEAHVPEHLDEDAAESEHDHGTEGRVPYHAQDRLDAAPDHSRHRDARERCGGHGGTGAVKQGGIACAHRVLVVEVEQDTADLGLVGDVG